MSEPSSTTSPPDLTAGADGKPAKDSVADIIEWFLNYDERTARIRHPQVNELFLWKQNDDQEQGIPTYPFENAEARFAIGVIQALEENNAEPLLKLWINDILGALQSARELKTELSETYKLDASPMDSSIKKSEKLTTNSERRMYLTSCWLEALLTAEIRVLGWFYQELYGRPFQA